MLWRCSHAQSVNYSLCYQQVVALLSLPSDERLSLARVSARGKHVLVSLAHFPVSKKRTTAHFRTPFHYFQLTSRTLTVSLLLPDSEKILMTVWSPYYSFLVKSHTFFCACIHLGNLGSV